MFSQLVHYLAVPRIRLHMQCEFHTTQSQLLLRTHLLSHHRSFLSNLHPDLAIIKRHHETRAGQITISEHLANISEVEAKWYQRLRQLEIDGKEEKDKLYREVNEEKDKHYRDVNEEKDKLYRDVNEEKDKLYREMINNAAENSRLQAEILKEVDEKLRLAGNFNIRGALERIVYQAKKGHTNLKQGRMIPNSGGVQKGLNTLAETEEFEAILKSLADERRLVPALIRDRAKRLYDEVSKHAHGNDKMITVRAKDFTTEECAALVTYLSMQKQWPAPLDWREELVE
ncbi:hypothetical protein HOY80DRAFT_1024067 [Tuber brumale]|nr:hypothetical protein HOY80DRAFT_1024067 [Tuber brumale]